MLKIFFKWLIIKIRQFLSRGRLEKRCDSRRKVGRRGRVEAIDDVRQVLVELGRCKRLARRSRYIGVGRPCKLRPSSKLNCLRLWLQSESFQLRC